MKKEMDLFSRNFDTAHFDNANKILAALKGSGSNASLPRVTTWELYDKSFSWPKVRQYESVQEGMETLEHFEDNLNVNITNKRNLANFLKVAQTVRKNLKSKYGSDVF